MSNQAGEDNVLEDLLNELAHNISEAAITAKNTGESFEYHAFDSICEGREAIEGLIRTEKLKLLDEVIHQSTVNLKSARAVAGWAELRKKQLEAEL